MKSKQHSAVQIMLVVLFVCILVSFSVGQYPVPLDAVVGILAKKIGLPIESFWTESMETAVWNICLDILFCRPCVIRSYDTRSYFHI